MGRHVNFADEQDRWLTKADKINRKQKSQSLEERDPASLSLAEQFELEKKKRIERKSLADRNSTITKPTTFGYSHHRPKS
jgi:hypothetical protein